MLAQQHAEHRRLGRVVAQNVRELDARLVRARVEPELKERAEAVLEKLGMSTADAIRILLTQVALRQAFPLELTLPTAERLPEIPSEQTGRD